MCVSSHLSNVFFSFCLFSFCLIPEALIDVSLCIVVSACEELPERAFRWWQQDPVQGHRQRRSDVTPWVAYTTHLVQSIRMVKLSPHVENRRPKEAVVIGVPLAAWANLRDRVWEDTAKERDVARGA